ncbi:hypothetical protein D3C77_158620 [compost metagenome]
MAVVQLAGHGQSLFTGTGENPASAVVEGSSFHREVLLADQRTGSAVEQGVFNLDRQATVATGERAVVAVVQAAGSDGKALPARNQAVLVEHTGAVERKLLATDQLAGLVVEVAPGQREALATGDFTALVTQITQVADAQRSGGGDQATAIVQVTTRRTEVEGDGIPQQRTTALIMQCTTLDAEAPGGVNQTLILVVEQPRDSQIKGVATGQGASLVTEAGGTHVEGRGGDQAFEVVQRLIDTQGQRLIAQQLAVTVVQTGGGQGVGLGTGEFTTLVVDAI